MCSASNSSSSAALLRSYRPGDASGPRPARRWFARLRPSAFKPVTYSVMHFLVAIAVAYALTKDWRIALGVGVIEPMVQTVAYVMHEKAWSFGMMRSRSVANGD